MALQSLLSSDYVGNSLTSLLSNNRETFDQMSRNLMGSINSSISSITMNMYEKNNKYHYELEIPGIEKEHIKLSQKEGFIRVSGERKFRNEVTRENYHKIESSYGKFERKFRLPVQADPGSLNAEFKNGMLCITVDKITDTDENLNTIQIN